MGDLIGKVLDEARGGLFEDILEVGSLEVGSFRLLSLEGSSVVLGSLQGSRVGMGSLHVKNF